MKIEIQKDLSVRPEDFYDYMIDEIRQQIEAELGRPLDPEELQPGLKLKRRQTGRKGQTSSSRYSIRQNKRPECFKALISSAAQKSMLTYQFAPSEKGCLFTYILDARPIDSSREPSGWKTKLYEFRRRTQISSDIARAVKECKKRTAQKED